MHFAISHRPTRGSISSYNIAGLISEVFEEVATQIAKNCRRQPRHPIWGPCQQEPLRISAYTLYLIFPETRVIGLHFCRCMYGSIFIQICALGSKRRIFSASECILAVLVRSRSSKVDDFSTNRKRIYDFLLVGHCDYGPIFHRFWDTATDWLTFVNFCYIFATPLSFGALAPYVPLEFCGEVNREETRVMGLSSSEDGIIVAGVVLAWYQRVTDGRSDGQTVGRSDRIYHS